MTASRDVRERHAAGAPKPPPHPRVSLQVRAEDAPLGRPGRSPVGRGRRTLPCDACRAALVSRRAERGPLSGLCASNLREPRGAGDVDAATAIRAVVPRPLDRRDPTLGGVDIERCSCGGSRPRRQRCSHPGFLACPVRARHPSVRSGRSGMRTAARAAGSNVPQRVRVLLRITGMGHIDDRYRHRPLGHCSE